jgi:penicillin-binding protein 1A
VVGFFVWKASRDLPDYDSLAKYEPPVMTRIHAHDGSLMAEYARERRIFVPINVVPKLVIAAFLSAEDKRFYEHGGLDFTGIARAVVNNLQNYGKKRPEGASTITQQVAKNFLLSSEQKLDRKLKEASSPSASSAPTPRTGSSSSISTRSTSAWAPTAWRPRRSTISARS